MGNGEFTYDIDGLIFQFCQLDRKIPKVIGVGIRTSWRLLLFKFDPNVTIMNLNHLFGWLKYFEQTPGNNIIRVLGNNLVSMQNKQQRIFDI